jgi:hypothetical protein
MIKKAIRKSGKTKTAFILEVVDEKLGLINSREQTIMELAGWMSHEEAKELRDAIDIFNKIQQGNWE